MLFAKVVAGAVATGVTVALALRIRTYMLNSDLENAVGGSSALKALSRQGLRLPIRKPTEA